MNEPADPAESDAVADAGATTEEHESGLVVVEQGDEQGDEDDRTEIERPDKLLRLAGMVQGLLKEVRAAELDDAGRQRLAEVHAAVVAELSTVVSEDLVEELRSMEVDTIGPDATAGQIQVAQAQLAGWLEGLFHGIRASVASQQRAMLQQGQQGGGQQQGGQPTGQYL